MTQPALFSTVTAPVGEVGDELGRFYTPDALAVECVRTIAAYWPTGHTPFDILEPSCGGGAFVRACRKQWRGCEVTGLDVDMAATDALEGYHATLDDGWRPPLIRHQDFLANVELPLADGSGDRRYDLCIGNPPFTGDTAIPHVEKALRISKCVAFILPWAAFGGVAQWSHVMAGKCRPLYVRPIMPRPWGDSVRETALFIWLTHQTSQVSFVGEPIVWK